MDKAELIKALLDGENPDKGMYILALEFHRINGNIGFGKFEVLDHKESIKFKGKLQLDTNDPAYVSYFANLQDGERVVTVGFLQVESKGFFKTFQEGFNSAIGEGKIPFNPFK